MSLSVKDVPHDAGGGAKGHRRAIDWWSDAGRTGAMCACAEVNCRHI